MALEFIDGFDHYANATNLFRKWDTGGNWNIFAAGRFGGNCIVNAAMVADWKTLPNQQTRVMGFAYYLTAATLSGSIAQFKDGPTNQVELNFDGAQHLSVSRNGTVLGTSTVTVTTNAWHYIEWKVKVDPAAGTYDVHLDGVSILSGTGNTQNTGNSYTSQVVIRNPQNATNSYLDDLYVLNTTGTVNNDFLGDCRVITVLPTSDGTNLAWTPDSGTAHFSRVNDSPNPDDDSSYVHSSAPGQLDTYKFAPISPVGPIKGVQLVLTERNDSTTGTTAVEYRGGGTNYTGANNFSTSSSYSMDRQIFDTDPATGAAWTTTGVNNGEFGINCIA